MLYIVQSVMKISQRVSELWRDLISKVSKGNNSVNNVGGVMVSFLCTPSDDPLYLYKVS